MKNRPVTDEDLARAEREAEAALEIIRALKAVAPEKRLNVLRAASVLSIGKDIDELERP